ncbi:MAG: hypothetical protein FWC00_02210 [Firmicutes bacterium]|nr:hypothetical protein [Bacillota bacterium]
MKTKRDEYMACWDDVGIVSGILNKFEKEGVFAITDDDVAIAHDICTKYNLGVNLSPNTLPDMRLTVHEMFKVAKEKELEMYKESEQEQNPVTTDDDDTELDVDKLLDNVVAF